MNIMNCLPRAEFSSLGQKSLLVKTVWEEFSARKMLIRVAMSLETIGAEEINQNFKT